MSSQIPSGGPVFPGRPVGQLSTLAYPAAEWELLTRLPSRIVVAAASAESDDPGHRVREGLAGLEGIAAGRAFDSELVRVVASTIYAEHEQDRPATGRAPALADVLGSCREAVRVLGARADPADSAAYRQWVQSIAARVCRAHRAGGVAGAGDEPVSTAGRRFLDDLGAALGLC
ncbi:hypothetical protein [Polymorphospora sp. NPDC050346]|uniref:hypothetical protein n=1 Tax=Polymorphospora sp. NPDC050346 TaxID=3155780 RepID=UPI0033F33686